MESTKGTDSYPYWSNEFFEEFKDDKGKKLQVYYREDSWPKGTDDSADSYRVFMILCNQTQGKTRMEVLQMLKDATEENPLKHQGESFWTEKD